MAKFPIRKGLDTPLLIFGVTAQNFYLLLLIAGGLLLLLTLLGFAMIESNKLEFVGVLMISLMGYYFLWKILCKKSKTPRRKFNSQKTTITNRDTLKYL